MTTDRFFEETTEQSQAKATIVSKYFWAWANVIIHAKKQKGKIAYIDLFAGPGRYKNGTKSTPILILEKAIQDRNMREMLITVFNDANGDNSRSLDKAIRELPGIDTLRHKPEVNHEEVGEEIVKKFEPDELRSHTLFCRSLGLQRLISAPSKFSFKGLGL